MAAVAPEKQMEPHRPEDHKELRDSVDQQDPMDLKDRMHPRRTL